MRRLVRDLEKDQTYKSDDEDHDPYASSAEELDSNNDNDDEPCEKKKEKKTPMPTKKKATAASKPIAPMTAHKTKSKKEDMSKPIDCPTLPDLSPIPPASPTPSPSSQGSKEPTKKRKFEVSGGEEEREHKRVAKSLPTPPHHLHLFHLPHPQHLHRQKNPRNPLSRKRKLEDSSDEGENNNKHRKTSGGDNDLITEQEAINTLRGKVMTTKEFLVSFRKRIKKDPRNRETITALLKKIAKSNRGSSDPNTRTLKLKPQ